MEDFLVIFIKIIIIISISFGGNGKKILLPNPKINFISSNEFNFGSNSNNPNITKISETVYVVPKGMNGCVLICNATYPITWEFHNAHLIGHAPWMLSIRTRRMAKKLFDLTTYEYSATLNMYGNYNRLTGNYTCKHTAREDLKSSIYIYWQDNSNQQFIQTNETIVVYAEDNVAVLPCVSSDPDFKDPLLQKIDNRNVSQRINYIHPSVRFEKTRGIILDNYPNITGNYTCIPSGNNPNDEFISIQVKLENETNLSGWILSKKSNASITYDAATSKVKCCSNSRRSPIMTHYHCNHPTMCEFRKKFVVPDIYGNLRKKSKKGCTTVKLYVHNGGLIHCMGDGIDSYQQYIFGLRNWANPNSEKDTPLFFNWAEINPHDMIMVNMNSYSPYNWRFGHTNSPDMTVYHGETLTFYCYTSEYYFAEGIIWAVKWKNNTLQVREFINNFGSNYRYEYSNNNFHVIGHVDMEAVVCIAPVWNSSEYIHKPYPLYVNVSSKPIINQTLEESHTWTMNDTNKKLECSAFGLPIPTIVWSKLDEWWHPAQINLNHTQIVDKVHNVSSENVTIDRVSYTTNGTYICSAYNFGGSVERRIHIFVEEPGSSKKAVAIIVGVALSLVLLTGIILMIWKLMADRRVIRQLSSAVTFKDGNIRPEPPSPYEVTPEIPVINPEDYINSSIHHTRLSANLID